MLGCSALVPASRAGRTMSGVRWAVLALLCFLLLAPGARHAAAQTGLPAGGIDVLALQRLTDDSLQPLPDAQVVLGNAAGDVVARSITDAAGTARLTAPAGTYALVVYGEGFTAVASRDCYAPAESPWQTGTVATWQDHAAIVDSPVTLDGAGPACRQVLFNPAPPPPAFPVHITIDDGYLYLCQTVDLVESLHIKVTFFLTGQAILAAPDCVRRLIADGDQLGNHTFAHEYLTRLSYAQIQSTLQRTENAAEQVAGVSTHGLCRPPYGAVNGFVRQALADWGCATILWDRDTRDWAGVSPASIINTATSVSCRGEIVLMHTQAWPREQYALPAVIAALRARGCEPAVF